MSLSYEALPPASYPPLEYREASDGKHAGQASEDAGAVARSGLAPDPEALFATRLEQERSVITAQARQDAEREIGRARTEIARAIEAFAHQRDEYFHQAEAEVVNLALAIARRILHRESQIDPQLLVGLVNYELEQLEAATNVCLFVSPDALSYWSEAAPTLSRTVEVAAEKALAPDELRIETALGATTLSFERELKEVERGFFDLLSHRPAAAEVTPARLQ